MLVNGKEVYKGIPNGGILSIFFNLKLYPSNKIEIIDVSTHGKQIIVC